MLFSFHFGLSPIHKGSGIKVPTYFFCDVMKNVTYGQNVTYGPMLNLILWEVSKSVFKSGFLHFLRGRQKTFHWEGSKIAFRHHTLFLTCATICAKTWGNPPVKVWGASLKGSGQRPKSKTSQFWCFSLVLKFGCHFLKFRNNWGAFYQELNWFDFPGIGFPLNT